VVDFGGGGGEGKMNLEYLGFPEVKGSKKNEGVLKKHTGVDNERLYWPRLDQTDSKILSIFSD
jgi:hypothetical protein